MRKPLVSRYAPFGHPMVAATLAALIVLIFGTWAASRIRVENNPELQPATAQPVMHVTARARSGAFQPVAAAQQPSRGLQPLIARTGKISLFVTDVDGTVRRLSRIARQNAGDVFSMDVSNEDQSSSASAQIEVRVPADTFDRTMDEAARIGKVRERSSSAEDLTGDITDSSARLRNLRQTENDILKIMDRSGNVSQVMNAENQLSQVREQIETLEASIASMNGRVAYSTIDFDVEAEVANQPVEPTAASQLTSAWRGAVHALGQGAVGFVSILLWLLVFAPVALAVGAFVFVLVRILKRILASRQTHAELGS